MRMLNYKVFILFLVSLKFCVFLLMSFSKGSSVSRVLDCLFHNCFIKVKACTSYCANSKAVLEVQPQFKSMTDDVSPNSSRINCGLRPCVNKQKHLVSRIYPVKKQEAETSGLSKWSQGYRGNDKDVRKFNPGNEHSLTTT